LVQLFVIFLLALLLTESLIMVRACHMLAALGFASLTAFANGAMELTKTDFDTIVYKSGKNAFVKFLAPW